MKRKALGKGLNALIPEPVESGRVLMCAVEELTNGTFQPRLTFDDEKIRQLADSIKESGIIQPLIVKKIETGYEIIAGERRWRAARIAGLKEVPVIVKELSDLESVELALIENIQREDLNPIEEARTYNMLVEEFGLTQDEVGTKVGRDRSSITNFMRLLKLPEDIQADILGNRLSMGQARALLGIDNAAKQREIRAQIISRGLSVRETEELVRRAKIKNKPAPRLKEPVDASLEALREHLVRLFGTQVRITGGGKVGKVEIHYYSPDDLKRIIDIISR